MNFKNFLLLIALSCCWGPSFLFIKFGLESFTPFSLVFFRLLIGGLILVGINYQKGNFLKDYRSATKDFFLIGLFANALPFIFITTDEIYIHSSLAAIMNSTTPLFTAIIAHFALADERLKPHKIIGVLVGMGGIFTIFYPSLAMMEWKDLIGCSLVLLGALSYSISFVVTKKRPHQVPILLFPAGQLLAASAIVMPLGLYQAPKLVEISLSAFGALMALSILGTATAFIIYFRLIKTCGATFVSYSSLLFPAIGILLGVVFLGESIHSSVYLGSLMIFLGVITACFYEPIREKVLLQKKASID